MIGILGEIKAWIGLLASLWVWLAIGGAIGFLGGLFRQWLGYPGVAVMGAAIMFAFVFFNWAADDSDKIARLEAENKALTLKAKELRLTAEALRDTLGELSKAAQHNEAVMTDLRAKLDAMPDRPECVIDKDIVDELNRIK